MANATLVVHNTNGLSNDIWQYDMPDKDFKWSEAISNFADTLQSIYDDLNTDEGGEIIDDGRLYVLGDVINMLNSINVKGGGEVK